MISRRVLVVQPNEQIRDVLSRSLARHGYTVFVTDTGERAASMLSTQEVEAVLLDLDLPSMSGQTLFHVIVSQWPQLRRRIAVMSDDQHQIAHADWLSVYSLPIVAKPIRLADVRSIVDFLTTEDSLEANGA